MYARADLVESVLKQFQSPSLCCYQAGRAIHQIQQEKHQGGVQFILLYLTPLQKAELSKTELPELFQKVQLC